MGVSFRRARRPEHKEERRAQLLDAAADFLDAGGPLHELGLSELARRAGMAKSNVYRYFESREALLLELLQRAFQGAFERLRGLAGARAPLPLDSFVRLFSLALAGEPLLGQLTSALPSVLEHNLSKDTIRGFKQSSLEFLTGASHEFHGLCPTLTAAEHFDLIGHTLVLITGLWPHAHPAPVVAEVVREPALTAFAHDFPRDLERSLRRYAQGLIVDRESATRSESGSS